MDIRSFGARPTRRLTQPTPSRPRTSGTVQGTARAGDAPPPGLAMSDPIVAPGVQPRSARHGYAVARRMQNE
ncbi:hypothetical protein [Salipiger bermudensis]|uniref:hypothetical protein n=1 Tax=Salipiger bermudensis TaxID=344736 RepID=UPI001A8C9FAA|nr:hypothetical protein [Salipiger bermudensis]MBN9678549.1 hypothetical protein [Salipiger bermudensis]